MWSSTSRTEYSMTFASSECIVRTNPYFVKQRSNQFHCLQDFLKNKCCQFSILRQRILVRHGQQCKVGQRRHLCHCCTQKPHFNFGRVIIRKIALMHRFRLARHELQNHCQITATSCLSNDGINFFIVASL